MIRPNKKRKNPEVSTASLPDIIFMLLFFFMVVTVLKASTEKVKIYMPETTFNTKVKQEVYDIHVFVGFLNSSSDPIIQINDKVFRGDEFELEISRMMNGVRDGDKEKIQVHLKVDKKVKMKIVNKIKMALRKSELYKLNYIVNTQSQHE